MKVEPYLFFDGRCEEAIEFFFEALRDGGKVQMPLAKTRSSHRASAWCTIVSACCGW
jgi:uncharacterized glyoxalase superfamily protein PhnB